MEKQISSTTKSDPIIIEQAGMRMTVAHRQGLGGSDEGLTFDITVAGAEDEGKESCALIAFTRTLIITSVLQANRPYTT